MEGRKEFVGVGHVETSPVIPDKERAFVIDKTRPKLNLRIGGFSRKLPGIFKEVLKRDSHQVLIGPRFQIRGNDYFHLAIRISMDPPDLLGATNVDGSPVGRRRRSSRRKHIMLRNPTL